MKSASLSEIGDAAHMLTETGVAAEQVVDVDGLRKTFHLSSRAKDFVAVDDVSFTVGRGECLGLVGESGSGKTTIAKLLLGIEEPDVGRIVISGRERTGRARSNREKRLRARELQIVFQDPFSSLDPRQSAVQVVNEVLRLHFPHRSAAERRGRTTEILESVGLTTRQQVALPSNLSGGQLQRIGIARALAAEPSAIVLDEAVSGLDVSIQAQVLNLLADLQEETKVAYIFISHDLSVIRQLADQVIVLRRGQIVESGRTDDVFDDPQHSYTQMLRAAAPRPGWKPTPRHVSGDS